MDSVVRNMNSFKGRSERELRTSLNTVLQELDSKEPNLYNKFHKYVTDIGQCDEVWKFWAQFVFVDTLAYVGLFVGVHTHLRTG